MYTKAITLSVTITELTKHNSERRFHFIVETINLFCNGVLFAVLSF